MIRAKSQIKYNLISVIFSLLQSCTERHTRLQRDPCCIACIYQHKRLSRLQKYDLADLVRRLLACIGSTCHGDETCVYCRKLTKVIWKYHINQDPYWLIKMFLSKFSTMYIGFIFILYSSN